MYGRGLERAAGGQLFVRIRDDEAPRVELPRGIAQVVLARGERAVARDVHAEDVVAGIALDHPLRQREADGTALREPAHAAAGDPKISFAGHRADERIAVGREGERTVHPALDADFGERGEARVADLELWQDAFDIGRQQIHAVVPGCAFRAPVARVAFIHAEQRALAERLQVGEALEVRDRHELATERGEHRHVVGDEVVVRHWHHRQVEARHATHAPRPKTRRVHHVLRDDAPLLGDHVPVAVGPLLQIEHAVAQDEIGAAAPRGDGEGMRRAMCVDIAFVRVVEAALESRRIDERAHLADLFGRDEARRHVHGLVHGALGLEHLPALFGGGEADAARHVHADALAALSLDLIVEPDGVALQRGDVRVVVERVETRGRMPGGARGELGALDERDVGPPGTRQVIEQARADDAAADDDDLILRLHHA